jgi:SAM-dependent methyltransferase
MNSMIKKMLSILPSSVKDRFRSSRRIIYSILYYGNKRWCPICEKSSRKFRASGTPLRKDAWCIHCDGLERHRFSWLFLNQRTDLFDGRPKSILHVAPEPCFESRFKAKLGEGYITADLLNRRATVKMDITNIQYPDDYFDIIYCSHVLEHVIDDKKAIKEFYRTLKITGWAILLVPITMDRTFEDYSIDDSSERMKIFGQEDHVRRYGPDFVDKLKETGFKVKVISAPALFDNESITRMGLRSSGDIYFCTKV